jgi:adenosylhomocysteinase
MKNDKETYVPEIAYGPDDQRATLFFNDVLNTYKVNKPIPDIAFITVTHLVPASLFFLNALQKIGRIAAVIPKSVDERVKKIVESEYPLRKDINKKLLENPEHAIAFLKSVLKENEKVVIIDIGGYFAACLTKLSTDPWIKERLFGIVEDTKNGEVKYERLIKNTTSTVISVAESDLKKTEDYNVGKSLVDALITYLRKDSHTFPERFKSVSVIGFGKIGQSIAEHLRQKGINVTVCEKDPILAMLAVSKGFKVVGLDSALENSDLLVSATGSNAIGKEQFKKLKNNVYIASVTSRDDEFGLDFDSLQTFREDCGKVTQYTIDNKVINFLNDGNAVNFLDGAVIGPYIYSVHAELLVCALLLIRQKNSFKLNAINEIGRKDMEIVANIWLKIFENVKLHQDADLSETQKEAKKHLVETEQKYLNKNSAYFLVPNKNDYFTGRKKSLETIQTALFSNSDKNAFSKFIVAGCGGIGKSELVITYAWENRADFPGGCFYIPAQTQENIESTFEKIAEKLQVNGENTQTKIQNVFGKLKNHGRFLLIFDDADISLLNRYFENCGLSAADAAVLVTTRNRNLWQKQKPYMLDRQEKELQEDGINYLIQFKDIFTDDSTDIAKKIAKELFFHPLALSQAISFMQAEECPPQKYWELLKNEKRKELLARPSQEFEGKTHEDKAKYAVSTTWRLSLNAIQKSYPNDFDHIKELLYTLSFLHPDNINKELFSNKEKELQILNGYCLISKVSFDIFKMNGLFQEVIRETDPDKTSTAAKAISLINNHTFYDRKNLHSIFEGVLHFESWEKACLELKIILNNPHYADMLYKVGVFLQGKNDKEKAIIYFEKAYDLVTFLDPSQQIKLKKQLAKAYTETSKWLYKADKLYKELRSSTSIDEELKYAIELDFSIYLKINKQYNESEEHLKKTFEALQKKKYPSLLARCGHHLGEHYANQVNGLYSYIRTVEKNNASIKSWQTKKQKDAEKSITVKQEEIAAFTQKAISYFEDSLKLKITQGDHLEVIRTTISMANLVNKELIQSFYNNIVKDVFNLYEDHLCHLLPKSLHLQTFHKVTLCLARLFFDCPHIFKILNLSDRTNKILRAELDFFKNEFGNNSTEYQTIYKLTTIKQTTMDSFTPIILDEDDSEILKKSSKDNTIKTIKDRMSSPQAKEPKQTQQPLSYFFRKKPKDKTNRDDIEIIPSFPENRAPQDSRAQVSFPNFVSASLLQKRPPPPSEDANKKPKPSPNDTQERPNL